MPPETPLLQMLFRDHPWLVMFLLAIIVLGGRELLATLFKAVLGKKKDKAELVGIHLSNTGQELTDLRDAMSLISEIRQKMEADQTVIAALKDAKIEDDRKIQRRDGIIEEQRRELKELHAEIGELKANEKVADKRMTELENRIIELERQNEEIVRENFQLKGLVNAKEQKNVSTD